MKFWEVLIWCCRRESRFAVAVTKLAEFELNEVVEVGKMEGERRNSIIMACSLPKSCFPESKASAFDQIKKEGLEKIEFWAAIL